MRKPESDLDVAERERNGNWPRTMVRSKPPVALLQMGAQAQWTEEEYDHAPRPFWWRP
jgi:hypothetical protein